MSNHAFQIRLKNSQVVPQFHPALAWAAVELADKIYSIGGVIPVITSGWDQQHGPNSLHYIGCAVDFRSKTIADMNTKRQIIRETNDVLYEHFGRRDMFDLLLEAPGQEREHFHLELDLAKKNRKKALRMALTHSESES